MDTYNLKIITAGKAMFMVGPRGRTYLDCLRHGRCITNALHDGALPGIQSITIQRDDSGTYAPPYDGLLPGDTFSTLEAAVDVCAAHVGVQPPADPATADLWRERTWETLERLGVLEEDDVNGVFRVRKMPERNDVPSVTVDEVWKLPNGQ